MNLEIVNFIRVNMKFGNCQFFLFACFFVFFISRNSEKRKIGKPKKRKWYEEDPKMKKKEPEELKIKGINC